MKKETNKKIEEQIMLLIKTMKSIIETEHENILYYNMNDPEKAIQYIKEKQEPTLLKIETACKNYFPKITDTEQRGYFLKIIENFAKYKAIIYTIIKKPDKELLKRMMEELNETYENLRKSIKNYEEHILR
ncbi:MAG: hypothetical protein KatS3mg002_0622 [Candidatus Woesearchaeota archaeon]|nr:MAG: hypothetical protein KatS3mg002_0622 [Candidatus Woesearchaeota archaeon]